MRVTFRTDASSQIGTGHVMRCMTLASALLDQGAECRFICREQEGDLIEHLRQSGHTVCVLPKVAPGALYPESELAHAHWLGVDWQTDSMQTSRALENKIQEWMVVDHYALDQRWESALRSLCKHTMVIDDLADRPHDCDLLLDQNYGSSVARYSGLVSDRCVQVHGPQYALLNPAYAELRAHPISREGSLRRGLIYFGGGTDEANLTGMALQAFQVPELSNIQLDIVVGAAYTHQLLLEDLVAQRGKATIYKRLPNLAPLMVKADFAIGAGGATTWERFCMGLPSIVISIAENQRPACEALFADQIVDYLGHFNQVTFEMIRDRVLSFTNKPAFLRSLGEWGRRLVDGQGVGRLVNKMELLS